MPCSTFPEAVVDICHPCPYSRVMSELPRHRCVSINNHRRAMPTTLDEAPPFFRSFYKFSFSLLWKVNKLYRYLFYLINSHILIHRVVKKKCFFLSSLIIVPPNYIHFPKVIYSTSGGRRDYFSPHSADYSFITVSGDGKQRGLVTEPE